MSDLQQEQAAAGGLGYPFLESLKPSSFLTLPLTKSFPFATKGAHLETAVQFPDDVLLWLHSHASAHGARIPTASSCTAPVIYSLLFGISSF